MDTNPAWNGKLVEEPAENGQIFWTLALTDGLTFTKTDYEALNDLKELENGIGEEITLLIYKICGSQETEIWEGKFTLLDAEHDRDRCQFVVQPTPKNDAELFLRNYENTLNFYLQSEVVANASAGTYVVKCCQQDPDTVNVQNPVPPATFTSCISNVGDFCATPETNEVIQVQNSNGDTVPIRRTCLHYVEEGGVKRCPTNEDFTANVVSLEYGRLFNTVLSSLITQVDPALQVVSNFFGINADSTAPSNDAYTYAVDNYQHLTIHQKSDVKRPAASNKATSPGYDITVKALLEDLRLWLNIYWDIIDDNGQKKIRIEHLSYFEETGTPLDLTTLDKWAKTTGKGTEIKKYEEWEMMDLIDETSQNRVVIYPVGEGTEEYKLTLFSADLAKMQNTFNAEAYSDKGFVLVCNTFSGGNYQIKEGNAPLFLQNTIDKLHRHGRFYPKFTHRTIEKDATSWKPLESQIAINGAWCCDELPIGKTKVTTNVGEGTLEKIEYDVKKDSVTYYPQF